MSRTRPSLKDSHPAQYEDPHKNGPQGTYGCKYNQLRRQIRIGIHGTGQVKRCGCTGSNKDAHQANEIRPAKFKPYGNRYKNSRHDQKPEQDAHRNAS